MRKLLLILLMPLGVFGQANIAGTLGYYENLYTTDGTTTGNRTVSLGGTFTMFDNGLAENILVWDGASWTMHADDVIQFEASQYCFDNLGQGLDIDLTATYLAGFDNTNGCLIEYPVSNLLNPEPWEVNGTTNGATLNNQNIHQNGDVFIGNGSASSAVQLFNDNNVATIADIKMNQQGLIQSESNQFYHAQTGNHTFLGGNTSGTTGATTLMNIAQSGQVRMHQYGSGTFTGTPAFDLCVTANGTIIEQPKVDNVNDADADPTNEIQSLSLVGNNLTLSNGGGTVTITHPASLDNDPTNEIQTLTVTKMPLYEYRDQWAEEGGGAVDNSAQYSYGNGATGFKGLPYDDGWEIIAVYIHSDNNGPNDDMSVFIHDYQTTVSNAAPIVATITYNNSGDGQTNNGYQYTPLTATIPDGAVLGFRTDNENGNVSDIVVGFRARRQIGEYVSDVTISN